MSIVHRQALSSLQPDTQNALVIGVITNSSNVKTLDSTRTRFNNGDRSVWTFMLRDSETDCINVTVWGTVEYVKRLSSTYHIGSVVEVINPKVTARRIDDRNEAFVPSVTSPCNLTINEGNGLVEAHDAPTSENYESLLARPIKNLDDLKSLKSIFDNLEALRDQYVDILIVVTFISNTRNIMTRDGRKITCRNFEGADGSTNEVVSLMIWENEWIRRSSLWEPKQTVLFLVDARVGYDNYKKKIVVSIVRKTLITENPDVPQLTTVRNAAQRYDSDSISDRFAVPNPETLTTMMTVKEITGRLNQKVREGERIQFSTILIAYVIEINVDNASPGLISKRCALCKKHVSDDQDSCMNLECPSGNGSRVPLNVMSVNLKVNLKDDTGYLIGCRLNGEVAESALGCTAVEFQKMTLPERAELKWKYVLERCDVRLNVLGPTSEFRNSAYNILSIRRLADDDEDIEDEAN